MLRFALGAVVLTLAGCPGPGFTPPPGDVCAGPLGGSADSLAIGAASASDPTGASSPFVPLQEGDSMKTVQGGQGLSMLGFVLSVSGASAPLCLDQKLTVTTPDNGSISGSFASLTTYEQPDGTRRTHAVWLPGDYPQTFVVRVTAGGQMLQLDLHLAP